MSHESNLPTDRRALLAGIGGLAAGTFLVQSAGAGELEPPPGPLGPTMKPLDEVEPRIAINEENTPGDAESLFRITEPGSYYLTANVTDERGRNGILVAANNVTIDLMGFTLQGSEGSLNGIGLDGTRHNIAVRNGVVTGWAYGIDLSSFSAGIGAVVENVFARENSVHGIFVGNGAIVRGCVASHNGSRGINVGSNGTVENCTAHSNNGGGLASGDMGTFVNCTARSNGFVGFSAGDLCTIVNCRARENQDDGISANLGAVVIGCSAVQNGSGAFGSGIRILGGIVRSCFAQQNVQNGILCNFAGRIIDCQCIVNDVHGIHVGAESFVSGSSCNANGTSNSGAGINAAGNDIRIEENNCCKNHFGIRVPNAGNFIARNTCSGNTTNWSIAANNKCLVVEGVNAGAINGNSGGTSPGSPNPHANYTF